MKRKIALYVCVCMAMWGLIGCADKAAINKEKPESNNEKTDEQKNNDDKEDIQNPKGNTSCVAINGLDEFDQDLITFIEQEGLAEENYMISPTSYKAALTLAVAGANGETKDQLLNAMGYDDMDELNAWYDSVLDMVEYYEDSSETLQVANSIWHNSNFDGQFSDEYIDYVDENYNAVARDVPSTKLTEEVNDWVSEATNNQIKEISNDLSSYDMLLVNSLYLKARWYNEFSEEYTATENFTTFSGEKVQKDFMKQQDYFYYYECLTGKLVIIPLRDKVDAVFVLGKIDDIDKAMEQAEYVNVDVKLPKLSMDSEFNSNYLIEYLKDKGAELPFLDDGSADFSIMCKTNPMYIDTIIQKTHIEMDEDGVEASAATAIGMMEATAMEPETPKEFYADEPFKFMLYNDNEDGSREVLFFGQIVE